LAHQAFADEEGVEAGGAEAGDVFRCADTAFGDAESVCGDAGDEVERGFEVDGEGFEVAVVDADGVCAVLSERLQDTVELFGGVDFNENIKRERVRGVGEVFQLGICESGGDEEDGVGGVCAGFDDLILVYGEVFAEAGERDGL
jgi:hypothetical protein